MKLRLVRKTFTDKSTIGALYCDDVFDCFTLEDTVRPAGVKIDGETAIPAGTYRVIVTMSSAFKREMPLLCDVPGFSGVRIHAGNRAKDTRGCILVGKKAVTDGLELSLLAFLPLHQKIHREILGGGKVSIEIGGAP